MSYAPIDPAIRIKPDCCGTILKCENEMGFTVEQRGRNVVRIIIPYKGPFEQRFLLSGDRHWDNPKSDLSLQTKHLDLAKRWKAGVIDVGDFFCAMQGKYDKRSSKSDLRAEHKVENYLDALVMTAADFFEKWSELFIVIAKGNHDTSILAKHETDLIVNLVKELKRRKPKSTVYCGGYSGWVHFILQDQIAGKRKHVKLNYHHGYGGGGPVTRDVIQTNRRAVYLPDADIVVSGHTHDAWNLPIARTRLHNDSAITMDEQLHVKVPTYKDEFGDGYEGFHLEKGRPPKPIGAYWLTFFKKGKHDPIEYEVMRAR